MLDSNGDDVIDIEAKVESEGNGVALTELLMLVETTADIESKSGEFDCIFEFVI